MRLEDIGAYIVGGLMLFLLALVWLRLFLGG